MKTVISILIALIVIFTIPSNADTIIVLFKHKNMNGRYYWEKIENVMVKDTVNSSGTEYVRYFLSDSSTVDSVKLESVYNIEKNNTVATQEMNTLRQNLDKVYYNPDGDAVFIDLGVDYVGASNTISVPVAPYTSPIKYKDETKTSSAAAFSASLGIPFNKGTFFIGGNYSSISTIDVFQIGAKVRFYLKK